MDQKVPPNFTYHRSVTDFTLQGCLSIVENTIRYRKYCTDSNRYEFLFTVTVQDSQYCSTIPISVESFTLPHPVLIRVHKLWLCGARGRSLVCARVSVTVAITRTADLPHPVNRACHRVVLCIIGDG